MYSPCVTWVHKQQNNPDVQLISCLYVWLYILVVHTNSNNFHIRRTIKTRGSNCCGPSMLSSRTYSILDLHKWSLTFIIKFDCWRIRWWHHFICTQQISRRCDSFVRFVPSQIPGVNPMSINSTKSKIVFTTSNGNSSRVENVQPQIHLIDSLIETCSSAELLWVTVSTSLSWSSRNVIHICICCHESKYTFELITEKCFITHIFLQIPTIIVSYGGNVQLLLNKNV